MPMSGSNYVAPTWVDNAPPAIDAAELQAMSDAIEANQAELVNLQSTAVSGTYTGDGDSSQYISLGFRPTAVLVVYRGSQWNTADFYNAYAGLAVDGSSAINYAGAGVSISSSGFRVSDAKTGNYNFDMNSDGIIYNYVAWKGADS